MIDQRFNNILKKEIVDNFNIQEGSIRIVNASKYMMEIYIQHTSSIDSIQSYIKEFMSYAYDMFFTNVKEVKINHVQVVEN